MKNPAAEGHNMSCRFQEFWIPVPWNLNCSFSELLETVTWTLLSFWSKSVLGLLSSFCVVVHVCAMGFLELVFALWLGLLIWRVVMVHGTYDEVRRQKPSQGESIEKSTQYPVWSSSSTTRTTRRASTQTSWEDMEFFMAPHGKVLRREDCRYLERCSKTVHLCQICFNR